MTRKCFAIDNICMKKLVFVYFWSVLLVFCPCKLMATITLDTSEDIQINQISRDYFSLIVENINSDGTSNVTNPTTAYIPIKNNNGTQVVHSTLDDPNDIPTIETGRLRIVVNALNNSHQQQYLYAAIKGNNDNYYLVSSRIVTLSSNRSVSSFITTIDTDDFCGFGVIDCDEFNTSTNSLVVVTLFYFLHPNIYFSGDSIDFSGTVPEGLSLKLIFSNRISSSSSINLSQLKKGDSGVIASFDGDSIPYYNRTLAVIQPATASIGRPFGQATVDNIIELKYHDTSGNAYIHGLTNGQGYGVAIAFENKFKYLTYLSNTRVQTPEELEVLLKKQSCFLLTAGFKSSHKVIDYFREFRDEVLKNYLLGRAFINFYYKYAPRYTNIIANNFILSELIKIVAWILYFIFNLWQYFLMIIMLLMALFLRRVIYGRP